jgi:CxxC motif-containing protein
MSINQPDRINEKEIVCVICPNSCRLTVWRDPNTNEVQVKGFQCNRGKEYGIDEYTNPVRMLITTMRIEGAVLPVIPVRSTKAIPKRLLPEAIRLVNESVCTAPIKMGQILIPNLLNTGIDVIAGRDMDVLKSGSAACAELFDENNPAELLHYQLVQQFYNGNANLSQGENQKLRNFEHELIEKLKKFGLQFTR